MTGGSRTQPGPATAWSTLGVNMEHDARRDRKTMALLGEETAGTVLVVGCGDGREAGLIARNLGADVVGVGLDWRRFDQAQAAPAHLVEMDAMRLAFADDSFDLIYSFHALEHIPDPARALREMRRVARPGARFLVGTPNRDRLIGYLGSPTNMRTKIADNLKDYRMRLRGRWSNAAGAHAGFAAAELLELCRTNLGEGEDVTLQYYERLYSPHERSLRIAQRSGIARRVFPAVYVVGTIDRPHAGASRGSGATGL